jgi:hypothetical protein
MKFSIFHPVNGQMNHDCTTSFNWDRVAVIRAESLSEAFTKGQNDFNPEYRDMGNRSTSVGDIIQSDEDLKKGVCHMVMGLGFKELPSEVLKFKGIDYSLAT